MSAAGFLLVATTTLAVLSAAWLGVALVRWGRRRLRRAAPEAASAFMAVALQETLASLRSQQQETQARAEASERLSSQVIESMMSGLIVVGPDGAPLRVNQAADRMLHLHPERRTESLRVLLAGVPPLLEVIEEGLSSGQPIVRRTLTIPRSADGRGPTHLGVSVSPLLVEPASTPGVVCLFTDLSAVAELEARLRLQESLSALGELTAGIAHEFRNGLAVIHGYARLIDTDRLPAEYQPYLQTLRSETDALGNVVTNFLNFARPSSLTLASVDIGRLVDRAVADVRSEVSSRGGEIMVSGDWVEVEGDEVLLRQALSNLLRNALEACTGQAPAIELHGDVDVEGGLLTLEVTDNGPGIPPANRERVFHPFFTTKSAGTGLGLALVQKIVVTHGGRVQVTAGRAGGACFQVALPLRQRASSDFS